MKRDVFFWTIVVACAVLLLAAVTYYVGFAGMVEERIDSTLLQEQLDLFRGRVDILLTVTTLVFGGAGALLLHFQEKGSGSLAQQRLAVLSLLSAGLSLFFGYMSYDAAIWMLRERFFNLETVAVRVPATAQLYTCGTAVLFLVLCFLLTARPGGGAEE